MTSRDDAVKAVVAAWRDEGPEWWVRQAEATRLRLAWPTLASAVEALAQAGDDDALVSTLRLLAEERARADRAEALIAKVRTAAHVPYGPEGVPEGQADADYLREAARKLDEHYKPFGSHLRATVVGLLREVADLVDVPESQEADASPSREDYVELKQSERARRVRRRREAGS